MISDKGIATCLDAMTGKQLWTERLGGDFCASPLYADGHIYLCDEQGQTHVLRPGSQFRSIAVNTLDAGCMASPCAVGDAIFVRTKTHLYCIAK
jgi:outer membrane protein assembly factor BamB